MAAGSDLSKKRASQLRKPHVYITIVAGLILIGLLVLKAEIRDSPVKAATAAARGTASSLTIPITTSSIPTTSPTTPPPPPASTSADAQAVQSWWGQHSGLTTALLNDEIALENDEFTATLSVTLAANAAFEADIKAGQSAPAIPDATMEYDWTNLLTQEQAAQTAVNQSIYANSASSGPSPWTQALDDFHDASTWEGDLDQDAQSLGVT